MNRADVQCRDKRQTDSSMNLHTEQMKGRAIFSIFKTIKVRILFNLAVKIKVNTLEGAMDLQTCLKGKEMEG